MFRLKSLIYVLMFSLAYYVVNERKQDNFWTIGEEGDCLL